MAKGPSQNRVLMTMLGEAWSPGYSFWLLGEDPVKKFSMTVMENQLLRPQQQQTAESPCSLCKP